MTAPETDVPTLSLPRSELLAYAMAARMVSGALRARREAAVTPRGLTMNTARMGLAADAAAIDLLTPQQAGDWNRIVADGEAVSVRVPRAWSSPTPASPTDRKSFKASSVIGWSLSRPAAPTPASKSAIGSPPPPPTTGLTDLRAVAKDIAADRAAA